MRRCSVLRGVYQRLLAPCPTRVKRKYVVLALAGAVPILGAAMPLHANIFTYAPPTLPGSTVNYTSVSESSSTNSTPLYGTPTVSGNNLVFSNLNFDAISTNASPALDFVDGQVNFTMQTDPGNYLSTLNLSEFGDYNVSATPSNPAAIDFAKIYPEAVQIEVLAINGVALATPLVNNTSVVMAYSPDSGQYQTGVTPSTGSFTGSATANLASLFGSSNITEIAVSFDNELLAESQVGGIADIAKKGFSVTPGVTVPEPSTAALAILAAGAIMLKRRRAY